VGQKPSPPSCKTGATSGVAKGARAPERVTINIKSGDSGIDFTTVSSASIRVNTPSRHDCLWDAIILSATATSITIAHVFQAGDVDLVGEYKLYPQLITPEGLRRCKPVLMPVIEL
jgi:hypothetical protein